jgi:hypothetical protein
MRFYLKKTDNVQENCILMNRNFRKPQQTLVMSDDGFCCWQLPTVTMQRELGLSLVILKSFN